MTPEAGMTLYLVTKLLTGGVEAAQLPARECLEQAEAINARRGFDGRTLFARCQWEAPIEITLDCGCVGAEEAGS